jgi:hypothetical protein
MMFVVYDAIGSEISRHRGLKAAGRVALERMAVRVRDGEGKDVTFRAKDAANGY